MSTSTNATKREAYPAVRDPSRRPVHPGAILRELLQKENKAAIARQLHISRPMLHGILGERRPLSAEMAIRFAALIGTEAGALLRMQADHDVWETQRRRRPLKIAPLLEAHG
jgi:antitoxin HigA-1